MIPLYFFYGDDSFLLNKKVNDISSSATYESLNLNEVSDLEALYSQGFNLPLFSTEIVLKIFLSTKCFKHLEKDSSVFLDLIKSISEYKTIIFVFYVDKLDKTIKKQILDNGFFSAIKELAQIEECSKLKPWQIDEIKKKIKFLASEYNLSFSDTALEIFTDCFKEKLDNLPSELQKLQTYLLPENFVSEELVKTMYLGSSTIDNLYNSILHKKYNSISSLINEITNMYHPLYLLASLQNKLRQALHLKLYKEFPGLHPYRVDKELEELKSVSVERLKNIISTLSTIELKVKSGVVKDKSALDLLIVNG